jgi:hypothetical protein
LFNLYGLVLETLGAFLLSIESIGTERFQRVYNAIYRLSKWSKKSIGRILLMTFPGMTMLLFGVIYDNLLYKTLGMSYIPIYFGLTFLIDHPERYEDLIIKMTRDHRIGPLGFMIMFFGFLFQLVALVVQMCMNL